MSEETALLAEPALAEDWSRPEEDAAWSHLQPESSFVILAAAQPSGTFERPASRRHRLATQVPACQPHASF
jgi:hypothetical protein